METSGGWTGAGRLLQQYGGGTVKTCLREQQWVQGRKNVRNIKKAESVRLSDGWEVERVRAGRI